MNPSSTFVPLAAFCWGVSGGIGGILMADGWDAFVVSFYRGVIGLLFVLVWLMLRPRASGFENYRLWFWSAIAGLGIAGNFAFYFVGIAQSSVVVAATLMYCAPMFVYLVSFALKLERPTVLKWAAIVVVMLGIIFLTQLYDISASSITSLGMVAGLLAGLSYAMFIFSFKNAALYGSPQAILSIAFAVLTTILIWPSDFDQIAETLNSPDWLLFAGLGVIGAGLSFALYVVGLNHTTPAVASIVAMVEPVTASLFGVVILNESLTGQQVFGMGLILVSVTMLNVYSSAKQSCSDYAP